jgi:inner membrane protein
LAGPPGGLLPQRREIWLLAFLGTAADLDFVPGLLMGAPSMFHHGPSHSLGFVLLAALVMGVWGLKHGAPWRWALVGLAAYGSHVLIDYFTADNLAPFGMPVWWPLDDTYRMAHHPLFMAVDRSSLSWPVIWHDIKAVTWEMVLLVPVTGLALWLRRRPAPVWERG